ncbi:hypothetical protein EON65_07460, partial [archaeon]
MGTLRWALTSGEDSSMYHGNIVSTVFSKDGTSPGKSKRKYSPCIFSLISMHLSLRYYYFLVGRRGSIQAVLSVQVTTWEGIQHIELTTSHPTLSMWHMALDLHYIRYSAVLPTPTEQKPDFFSLTTPMSLLLGNTQHTLTLSLLDNASQVAQDICTDYRLDNQHALAIENALLKEQLQLLSPLVRGYRTSLAHNHSISVECELLRVRAEAAEEHSKVLDRLVGEMEIVLPQLTQSSL